MELFLSEISNIPFVLFSKKLYSAKLLVKITLSIPDNPSKVLLPLLPIKTLLRELPVALRFETPVRVKFSTLVGNSNEIDE